MDISFHYPPELFSLLVDTIPLLCRSKNDTLLFIRGAGVSPSILSDLSETVRVDRKRVNKYEIVRATLTRLNERGETALQPRRELLKRVVEFEDFSTCWDNDRLKAQGLVAQCQKLVNVKDSFTRMKLEREAERKTHIERSEAKQLERAKQAKTLEGIKKDFYTLFGIKNPSERGKKLEGVLNELFDFFGISVREAFALKGSAGEGVVEQIDGVIDVDGSLYFVEMKWWQKPVGVPEISQHLYRVFTRAEARALIISASAFTAPAVSTCKEALSQKVVSLCTLQDFVNVLEASGDLQDFLRRIFQATMINKNPMPQVPVSSLRR